MQFEPSPVSYFNFVILKKCFKLAPAILIALLAVKDATTRFAFAM